MLTAHDCCHQMAFLWLIVLCAVFHGPTCSGSMLLQNSSVVMSRQVTTINNSRFVVDNQCCVRAVGYYGRTRSSIFWIQILHGYRFAIVQMSKPVFDIMCNMHRLICITVRPEEMMAKPLSKPLSNPICSTIILMHKASTDSCFKQKILAKIKIC